MRMVMSVVCALALLGLAYADGEKAKDVKLDGKVCCAKCELGKEKKCAIVIVVKKGDKDETYYFDKDSHGKYHKDCCEGSHPAKVEGKVTEKDGKMWIAVEKLEMKK